MDTLWFSHVLQHREASQNIVSFSCKVLPDVVFFPPRCVQGCSDWLGFFAVLTFTGFFYQQTGVQRPDANAAFPPSGISESSQRLIWFVFPLGGVRPRC